MWTVSIYNYNACQYIYTSLPVYKCRLSVYIYNLKMLHLSYFLGVMRQTAPHMYMHYSLKPEEALIDLYNGRMVGISCSWKHKESLQEPSS